MTLEPGEIINNIQPTETNNENNNDDGILNEIPQIQNQTQNENKRPHRSNKEIEDRERAINNFKNGIEDPEYNVMIMTNGKYRVSRKKNKQTAPPTNNPINLNQIPENKPTVNEVNDSSIEKPKKHKEKDGLNGVVYYNLNNQLNEQLIRRLDSITSDIERLRNKNKKLKNKYKNLKQAIYISEDEDENQQQIPSTF